MKMKSIIALCVIITAGVKAQQGQPVVALEKGNSISEHYSDYHTVVKPQKIDRFLSVAVKTGNNNLETKYTYLNEVKPKRQNVAFSVLEKEKNISENYYDYAYPAKKRKSSSNVIEKGNIILEAYYGYPYIVGKILNTGTGGTIKNTNHLGIKGEYLFSDKFSIGLDFTFASAFGKWTQSDTTYTSSGMMVTESQHSASITKIRILPRFTFHFVRTDELDAYTSFGIGYKQSKISGDENAITLPNLFPVSIRAALGVRYYFTENIGINVETGLGGPAFQAGVSVKF